jgi:flagellar biosynthesis chaperone FliJ
LRDKQWSRYEQDRKRREDAAYDEVAVQQFLRLARKPASAVHSR